MSLEYSNPELVFRMIMMSDRGDSIVFICNECLLKHGFRADDIQLEDELTCFVKACPNEAIHGTFIMPEFISGFEHHDLL